MSKPELHGATLPDGWTVSRHHSRRPELLLIERQKGSNGFDGFVSINMQRRIFDGGECNPVRHAISGGGPSEYRGRNWAKRLIEDACAWLEKTMTTRETS